MSKTKQSQGTPNDLASASHAASMGSAGAAQPPRAVDHGGWDAPPSNTASHSYRGDTPKVLRIGVDSLYASFEGEITGDVEFELINRKQLAQSRRAEDQACAQWESFHGNHLFEVKDKGQRSFPYILEDNAFRIALSTGESHRLPLAYCKVSSEYLAHTLPDAALRELVEVVSEFGDTNRNPNISRIDLYVDFQTSAEPGEWRRDQWVTRAGSINSYSDQGKFTGWTVGLGGPISARLYDKTAEILKSQKFFFYELWDKIGWDRSRPVWRLEFQVRREVLTQLGIQMVDTLWHSLGGIWAYGTQKWLRLAVPVEGDTNRARWPTHALWEALGEIRWRLDDVPLLRRRPVTRVPSEEKLFRMTMSYLTSFMALRGIHDVAVGRDAFWRGFDSFFDQWCPAATGLSVDEWVTEKVRLKGRRFNTIRNLPGPREEAATTDEVERDAADYSRASRGE